jgi:hypothetical protein
MKRKFALSRRKSLRQGTIDRLLSMPKPERNALIYGTRDEPRRNGIRVGTINFRNGNKIRHTLRQFTPKRQITNREYERVVRIWQAHRQKLDGFRCQFIYADGRRCTKKCVGKRPHHTKGRGKYLCDVLTFLALDCALHHHRWVHDHPKEAAERGLLIREYAKHTN